VAGLENLDLRLPFVRPRIAVVGAGWSGLAAAIELTGRADVTVFEAGRAPGGRARRVRSEALALDNGQHILLGAYRECLRLMRKVGVDPERALLRQPLNWWQPDGMKMRCPRLPAPLHLAGGLLLARGISGAEKWQLARALGTLSLKGWRIEGDPTVADWLAQQRQRPGLIESFWRPLVLSALNTPVDQASMRILAAVLRDSLGAAREASDLLLPRTDLSSLFPDPAWRWLEQQGATLRPGCRVRTIHRDDSRPAMSGAGVSVDGERFDAVIMAVAPYHATSLLNDESLENQVKGMTFWPIYTVYLCFDHALALPQVMTGLRHGVADWFFDRNALCHEDGLVAAVISAPAPGSLPASDALVARVLADLRKIVPDLPEPRWTRLQVDRRATFAACAGGGRPGIRAGGEAIYLAGDWVESDYPATLEGAVRSGVAAARTVMCDLNP
jgi:squalene-associated FAD-dependent desaturase